MRNEGVYVRVHVTSEDIRMGQRCRGARCPIALASSRALGAPVYVAAHLVRLPSGKAFDKGEVYEIPLWVGAWLTAYDAGRLDEAGFEPFAFEAQRITWTAEQVGVVEEFCEKSELCGVTTHDGPCTKPEGHGGGHFCPPVRHDS